MHGSTVRLLDAISYEETARLEVPTPSESDIVHDMVSVGFGGFDELVSAVPWDAPAVAWWTHDGTVAARLAHERPADAGPGRVTSIALSPGGRYAATIGGDRLRMWKMGAGEPTEDEQVEWSRDDTPIPQQLDAGPISASGVAFAEANQTAVANWSGKTVRFVRDIPAKELRMEQPVASITASYDGQWAVIRQESGRVSVHATQSGNALITLEEASDVAISHAAGLVGVVRADGLEVYRVSDGASVAKLPEVRWAKFSPQGRWLVSTPDRVELTVWDTATWGPGLRVNESVSHTGVLFTEDDGFLATATETGGVRLWNIADIQPHLVWNLGALSSLTLSFVYEDRVFEALGSDRFGELVGRSAVWRTEDLMEEACATVNRRLTDDEVAALLPEGTSLAPCQPTQR